MVVKPPDVYLVTRILQVLYQDGPMKKTNAQMLSRINYNTFKKYLDMMIILGMIETKSNSDDLLKLSDRGKDAYRKLSPVVDDLRSFWDFYPNRKDSRFVSIKLDT